MLLPFILNNKQYYIDFKDNKLDIVKNIDHD